MNTRNRNLIAALLILPVLMLTGSCKKYLDQQPITELGPEQVFKDVSSTYKALIGVYSRLVGDQGYGIRLSLYYTVDSDEIQGPTGSSDNDRRDIARYIATAGNAQLERPFNQLFQGIEYANICIDNIPKMDMYANGSDKEKKQLQRMYGEALTLRAQFYLEAIRNWGDLPEHFQPAYAQAASNPFPAKVDKDVLYDKLLADLEMATDLVPWRSEITSIGDMIDERITKGTVKALRARIALYRGGYSLRQSGQVLRGTNHLTYYQIAKEECEEIMNSGEHTLNPSFRSLWKDQVCAHAVADPNGELMFQASAIGLTSAEDTKLGYYNGPRVNNRGNSSYNPLPSYFYLFDSTDLRRDVTITPYFVGSNGITKIGQAASNLTDGKFRRDWITNPSFAPTDAVQYFSLKWQIIRYADVLLMYAEAENEINGPSSTAYNAINMVRRRGFGKPIGSADPTVDIPAGLSKTDFFKYLVRERALEFGGEGIRKYDLMRWNLMPAAVTETRANLVRLSTNSPIVNCTYMAEYPSYSISNTLPTSMYFNNNSSADDYTLWRNSFYKPAPASTPSGTTRVNWIHSSINTTCAARFATGFTTGKSELMPFPNAAIGANPNLTQNPGY